jgi:simple sugar transport system permease protein
MDMTFVIDLLTAGVKVGTILLFATLGEILTEKAGNLNLGVEGMMLMGAVIGFMTSLATANPWLSVLGAMAAGAFGAAVYAFLTVSLRANQNVTGLALTIFGTGFASFAGQGLMGLRVPENVNRFFAAVDFPLLSAIPVIGPIFFKQNVFVYLGYVLSVLLGIYLHKTRPGLNLTMTGENPAAADAAGISVTAYKYVHVIAGGALCGLSGAYLSMAYIPNWQENVTAGRGWIAVALVIFCAWSPYRALFSAFLFGCFDVLGVRIQKFELGISPYFFDAIPYLATILILVFATFGRLRGRATPASLGLAYFREDR